MHSQRVPHERWNRARAAAEAKGSNLTREINAFLERLARQHERKSEK